jgi:hypothetical protein
MLSFIAKQLLLGLCRRNFSEAGEADGFEATIRITPLWVKNGESVGHRICLFPGSGFNLQETCLERCPIQHSLSGELSLMKSEAIPVKLSLLYDSRDITVVF